MLVGILCNGRFCQQLCACATMQIPFIGVYKCNHGLWGGLVPAGAEVLAEGGMKRWKSGGRNSHSTERRQKTHSLVL
jgi:hypothetical protein